ncbi:MAG: lipoprotein insertase outer membrane protein LolB [Gammaproteobacteria bacterium]
MIPPAIVRAAAWMLILAFAGCAVRPPVHEPAAEAAWLAHRASLEALTRWQVQGRVAVRAGDEGWSANFDWHQQGEEYRIRLRGPFGQGAVELHGNAQGVWLRHAEGKRVFARDPETLVEQETGWRLPVSGLRSWLLGLPAAEVQADYQWDAQGTLVQIEQAGWHIDYNRYQQSGPLRLPARLRLERDSLKLRFVIDNWRLS